MAELIKLGKELGYEGQELRDWVSRQQDIQRADRTAEREAEKAKAKAEKARAEADAEKVRVEAEAEKARAEADAEKVRVEAEAEKARAEAEIERFKLEAQKELELEKMRQDLEKEKIDLARQVELQKVEIEHSKSKDRTAHARDPKLPYFDDSKDKMDSYLLRFEKYATANKWDPNLWAAYLSALLKGRALDVYDRLSNEDAASYDKLKEALLKNFDMTERGFRKKFRYSRPEKSETFMQFSSRLNSYLNKWLAMAKVEKSYEAVCDFMARDQFLDSCSRELYVHLKPKTFKNLEEMAREADLFAEARGGVYSCVAKGQREKKDKTTYKNESSRPGNKPEIKCRICGKPHLTYKCWNVRIK